MTEYRVTKWPRPRHHGEPGFVVEQQERWSIFSWWTWADTKERIDVDFEAITSPIVHATEKQAQDWIDAQPIQSACNV